MALLPFLLPFPFPLLLLFLLRSERLDFEVTNSTDITQIPTSFRRGEKVGGRRTDGLARQLKQKRGEEKEEVCNKSPD